MPLPLALSDLGLKLEHLSGASDKDAQQPRIGQTVTVRYTGRLRDSSGTVFDSTDGKPDFSLRVGRGMVIGGWDAALLHMTCGSRYRLTVPAVLAYGARGKPGLIPPNSQLCFDIELTGIVADSPAELLLDAASTGDAAALVRALAKAPTSDTPTARARLPCTSLRGWPCGVRGASARGLCGCGRGAEPAVVRR